MWDYMLILNCHPDCPTQLAQSRLSGDTVRPSVEWGRRGVPSVSPTTTTVGLPIPPLFVQNAGLGFCRLHGDSYPSPPFTPPLRPSPTLSILSDGYNGLGWASRTLHSPSTTMHAEESHKEIKAQSRHWGRCRRNNNKPNNETL